MRKPTAFRVVLLPLTLYGLATHAAADTFGAGANQFTIEFVTIGDPGNPADTTGYPNPAGSVPYVYRIGKYEVSRDMIAKANSSGGLQIGLDELPFVTSGPRPDMPATSLTWNEAARFADWLNTSQGFQAAYKFRTQPGEAGYDSNEYIQLWQTTDAGFDPTNVFRNKHAKYFLPSLDEWYKAAYYDPHANRDLGGYWDYPNGSDSEPTPVASGSATGTAVYTQQFDQGPADITEAGGPSPYGVIGLGGNAWEWCETERNLVNDGPAGRLVRGGGWSNNPFFLTSSSWFGGEPSNDANFAGTQMGFRVASITIPEPSRLVLSAFGAIGLLAWARRSCRRPSAASSIWLVLCSVGLSMLLVTDRTARGDIYRWDNEQVIPGTEGITPRPGVQLYERQLEYADLRFIDLSDASFYRSNLTAARFVFSTLTGANLREANLAAANLDRANLTNASLTYSDLSHATFGRAFLTNANLTEAIVTGADFGNSNVAYDQLASTASYQQKTLQGIGLVGNHLYGWDFNGQNLAGANLSESNLAAARLIGANLNGADLSFAMLTDGNLSGASVRGADLEGTTDEHGFTKDQLYSTASYQAHDLERIGLGFNDLSGWDFSEQNLADASLNDSTLTNANLTGAVVRGTNFQHATFRGFTPAQLYSTASYQSQDLQGIVLGANDLTGWDLTGQNLTDADLHNATLTGAKLAGAVVRGGYLSDSTSLGFTADQLYSTASYQAKDLQGIQLLHNDLTGWDFGGQNLTQAGLVRSILTNANLSGANLTNTLLYATVFAGADLTAVDLRGAKAATLTGTGAIRNAIHPDGTVLGVDLASGDELAVRDDDGVADPIPHEWLTPRAPIPINVNDHFVASQGGVLRLVLEADAWDSLVSFQPGIPVTLGGTLELSFAADVNLSTQVGRTIHIFDWNDVAPTGAFGIASPYVWDLSRLYSSGEVTLLAIPEPPAIVILLCVLFAVWRATSRGVAHGQCRSVQLQHRSACPTGPTNCPRRISYNSI